MPKERNTTAPQIIDEASEWFVIMREPDTSTEDREAFAEWLRASPVHVSAYLEMARLWADTSHLDRALSVDLETDPTPNVVPIRQGTDSSLQRARKSGETDGTKRTRLAIAASVLITVLGVSAWLYTSRGPTYATDIGEQRTISLEDGSIVKLNSRSRFTVRMSRNVRQIELVDGQALFQVAHETNRPFIVTSGNSSIRAVGTQFDVNRKNSGTIVTVIEGRVRLDPAPLASQTGSAVPESDVYVSAGEQMRIAITGAMQRSANPNTAAAVAWLQQELIFEDQSLTDVLEEFNRYSRTPIVLADPTLGDLRINAVFHTTNPDSLLRFLSRYDTIRVDRSEKEVRISRR